MEMVLQLPGKRQGASITSKDFITHNINRSKKVSLKLKAKYEQNIGAVGGDPQDWSITYKNRNSDGGFFEPELAVASHSIYPQ